jgi:hypothetical protein
MATTQETATAEELLQFLSAQIEDLQQAIKGPGLNLGWGKSAHMTVHCSRHHVRWYEWVGDNENGRARLIEDDSVRCLLKGIHLFESEFKGKITQKADVYVDAGEPIAFRVSVYTATGRCLLGPILKLTPEQRLKPITVEAVHETKNDKVLLMNVSLNEENVIFQGVLPQWEQLQAQVNQLNTEMGFVPPERKEKKEPALSNGERLKQAMVELGITIREAQQATALKYLPKGKKSAQCTDAEIDAAIAQMNEELAEF